MSCSANTTAHECTTVQLLSQESILQEKFVFLFFDDSAGEVNLCGGLNLARFEDLTIATFHRWMTLVDSDEDFSPFLIWPVEITRFDVLHYFATPVRQPLPRTSAELMPHGDYGVYYEVVDGEMTCPKQIGRFKAFSTFPEGTKINMSECDDRANAITMEEDNFEPFTDAVKKRDQEQCCITGCGEAKTEITWIVPPSWAEECNPEKLAEPFDITEQFRVVDNLITIDTELFKPFSESKFGIDVEDKYRIVIFEDFPQADTLGKYLSPDFVASTQNRADIFFQGHFRWSIGVNSLGGHVPVQHPYYGQELIIDADKNGLDKSDPKWKSPLGQELFEVWGFT